jgi:glycosyltransferase involved in cell wall biosynthesis
MKILNLIQCLNLGGMEQASYLLMKETQRRGITWQVQSITPSGSGKEIVEGLGIPVADNPYVGKFGYKSHLSLKRKVRHFSSDLILVTGPTLTGCLSVRSSSCKKILGVHFCHQTGLPNFIKWKLFYALFGDDYDVIIYYSPFTLEEAKQIAPQLQHKFYLIENSVQRCSTATESEKKKAREVLGVPIDAFVIGNAGWLIERKRFDIFLEVCATLQKQIDQNLIFLIAGDGPLHDELQALSVELGIDEKVRFVGWQRSLDNFYCSLDLLLFNSNSDAFGRTVLEAMGYGIPVVASVIEGGTDSVLQHQSTGYLLREHNVAQLAEYCRSLMRDRQLYESFQNQALALIHSRFSMETFIEKHLSIFNQVVGLD